MKVCEYIALHDKFQLSKFEGKSTCVNRKYSLKWLVLDRFGNYLLRFKTLPKQTKNSSKMPNLKGFFGSKPNLNVKSRKWVKEGRNNKHFDAREI